MTHISLEDHEAAMTLLRVRHDARSVDLLHANNRYQEEGRAAREKLQALKAALTNCEPAAADLAATIIDTLAPGMSEAEKRHELNVLSDALQTFAKDLAHGH